MKLINFFVATLIIVSCYFVSNAACPPGYAPATVSYTLGDGCQYDLQLCYYCSPLGNFDGWVRLESWRKHDPYCSSSYNTQQIYNALINLMTNDYALLNSLCTIKPCSTNTTTRWTFSLPICWEKRNDGGAIVYELCSTDGCWCLTAYNICYNGSTLSSTLASGYPTMVGSLNCTDTEAIADQNNYPYNDGDVGGCFYLKTACNN